MPTHSNYGLTIEARIDYSLRDLHFVDALVGYAVGARGQVPVVYKTVDGGRSWRPQHPKTGCNPTVIRFADEATGLITLHDTTGCPEACEHRTAALITDDGGATWRRIEYPELRGHIIEIVADEAGNWFGLLFRLFLSYGTSQAPEATIALVRSEDNGRSWNRIHHLPQQAETPRLALRHHRDELYLTWSNGSILVFDLHGNLVDTLETGYQLVSDLVVVSEDTILATVSSEGAINRLVRSIDAGRIWSVLLDEPAKIAFARTSDEFGAIVSRGYARRGGVPISLDAIAHTTDGGGTWRESDQMRRLSFNMKRRVRPPGDSRDLLLLGDRFVAIHHAERP